MSGLRAGRAGREAGGAESPVARAAGAIAAPAKNAAPCQAPYSVGGGQACRGGPACTVPGRLT
ncbi:protein of unknown function [Thauera humireducens]|nr:protein of unknown function [Thauera humireducens]